MAGADPTITIPSIFISLSDANLVKGQLPAPGVNATLRSNAPGLDASYRWLVGEDSAAFGGAIRDMWTPTCAGAPAKVSDTAVPAAATARRRRRAHELRRAQPRLRADRGRRDLQRPDRRRRSASIKAAHIYYRAMTVYQGPASDFADHADALERPAPTSSACR